MSPEPGNTEGRPSWRQGQTGEPAKREARVPSWRSMEQGPGRLGQTPSRVKTRWRAVLKSLMASFAALLVAAVAYWITTFVGCTRTELLVVVPDGSSSCALPSNVRARQDARFLESLNDQPRLTVTRRTKWPRFTTEFASIDRQKVLVVYVCAPAFLLASTKTTEADVSLLGPEADVDVLEPLIHLDSLAQSLHELPTEQRKLVLLDLCHITTHWRLGIVENSLSEALQRQFSGIENLAVILACRDGERSWLASEIGPEGNAQSVFAYFVVRGLQGDADQAPRNGRVSVGELFDYVARNTDGWVRENRDVRGQHPVLLSGAAGEPSDFSVVRIPLGRRRETSETATEPEETSTATGSATSANAAWDQVEQLWQARQRLDASARTGLLRSEPTAWAALTHLLLETEDRLLAGQVAEATAQLDAAAQMLKQLDAATRQPPLSECDDLSFVRENIAKRIDLHQDVPVDPGNTETTPPSDLERTEDCVQRIIDAAAIPPETSELVKSIVELQSQAEEAVARSLGHVTVVAALIQEADRLRREAFDWLCVGDHQKTVERLTSARERFDSLRAICRVLERAETVQNRLYAELPAWAAWSAFRMSPSDRHTREAVIRAFRNAVAKNEMPSQSTLTAFDQQRLTAADRIEVKLVLLYQWAHQIEQQLARVDRVSSVEDLTDLAHASDQAEELLDGVTVLLETYAQELDRTAANESAHPQPTLWRELRDVARCPSLQAESRRNLHTWLRDFARKMNQSWFLHQGESGTGPAAASESEAETALPGFEGGMWASFWAIHVLSLAARDQVAIEELWDQWYRAWREVARDDRTETDLRFEPVQTSVLQLGAAIRLRWQAKWQRVAALMGQSAADAATRHRALIAADQVARTLHPCDAMRLTSDATPARERLRFDECALLLTEAQRCIDDFWADWYEQTATECLAAAQRLGVSQFAQQQRRLETLLSVREKAGIQIKADPIRFGTKTRTEAELRISPQENLPEGIPAVWLDWEEGTGVALEQTRRQPVLHATTSTASVPESVVFELRKLQFDESRCPFTFPARTHVFFRGHRWPKKGEPGAVVVHPCRPTGVTLSYRPSDRTDGQIVVHGTDARAIIFIIDSSISMTAQQKWETARSVFRATLANLVKFNESNPETAGVRIAVLVFGRTTESQIESLQDMRRLDAASADRLDRELAYTPRGKTTPLLAALIAACHQLEQNGVPGTVVAITDGEYKDANPNDLIGSIDRLLNDSRDSGRDINVDIVGFNVPANERAVLQTLTKNGQRGRFHNAPDGPTLARVLKQTTDPRPYTVRRGPLHIEKRLGDVCTHLNPGRYAVSFGSFAPVDVEILGGEKFEFELDRRGVKLITPAMKYRADRSIGGFLFGCREFDEDRQRRQARFLFSLTPQDRAQPLPRPRNVAFEIQPLDERQTRRRSMTVRVMNDQSVPTWEVIVEDWPRGSGARVQAYWRTTQLLPDAPPLPFRVSEQPQRLEWTVPETGPITLLIGPVRRDVQAGTAEIQVRLPQTVPIAQPERLLDELARLRLALVPSATTEPLDLACSAEFIAEEGSMIYRLEGLPPDLTRRPHELHITAWSSFAAAASHLNTPLLLLRPDE